MINESRINAPVGDFLVGAVARERNATVINEITRDFVLFKGVPADTYR